MPEVSMPEMAGVEHRWVNANGVRLHVAEIGSGPPVLLIHGFPQHWYAWRDVAAALAPDHRVIMPDMRGFGWSDAPRTGYDSTTRVDDLVALLDALDLETVTVCGHEWGAWAGFMLSLRVPSRIRGLVALNVQHPWPLHRRLLPSTWRYWYTAFLEIPFVGRTVLRRWPAFTRHLLDRRRRTHDRAYAYADVLREPDRARAGEALHRAFIFGDILPLARNRFRHQRLEVPTIHLGGERDHVVSARALTAVHPPQPCLDVRIVGGGHYLHEDAPSVVVEAVREVGVRDC